MANMSYCRFENTRNDLQDCVRALEDAYDLDDLDLSASEEHSMNAMLELCQEFLDAHARLEAATVAQAD